MARVIAFAKRCLFPFAGILLGLAVSTMILRRLETLEVHPVLLANEPNRAYVSVDCVHCQKALTALSEHRGDRGIVVIPIPSTTIEDNDRLCTDVVRVVRSDGGLLFRLLSEQIICRRLMNEARAWLESFSETDTVEVPTWVINGQMLPQGWSEENIAVLQAESFLSRTYEPPQSP